MSNSMLFKDKLINFHIRFRNLKAFLVLVMLSVKHLMVDKLNVLIVTRLFSCAPHLLKQITNFKTHLQRKCSLRTTLEKVNQSDRCLKTKNHDLSL